MVAAAVVAGSAISAGASMAGSSAQGSANKKAGEAAAAAAGGRGGGHGREGGMQGGHGQSWSVSHTVTGARSWCNTLEMGKLRLGDTLARANTGHNKGRTVDGMVPMRTSPMGTPEPERMSLASCSVCANQACTRGKVQCPNSDN